MKTAARTHRHKDIARHLRALAPLMPLSDFNAVLAGAIAGHLRHLPTSIAVWLALTSHVRHAHSDYDRLLEEGYDRDSARFFVIEDINATLARWGVARRVTEDDDGPADDG